MSTPGDKVGPLSAEELEAIWAASVDKSYRDPLVAAGDGGGMEVYRQSFAQLERASLAVDRSFQSLFALPFSGQSQPPASGAEKATVALTFTRSGYVDRALVLGAGLVWVDEEAIDSGDAGGEPVDTGRRYVLAEPVVFFPGEQGPFTATAIAEKPGWGYNNPLPGTIALVERVGAGFQHDLATVSLVAGALPPAAPAPASGAALVALNEPDMFVPDHVGQYVRFIAGANAGKIARMVGFAPPDAANDVGSAVALELLASVATSSVTGTFAVGEEVIFGSNAGSGVVAAVRSTADAQGYERLAIAITSGALGVGTTFTGATSGATATCALVYVDGTFTAEAPSGGSGGATWRVLDWVSDLGVTASNAASPAGGALGMLDLLGDEKKLPRAPGEDDETYRERITTVADVVSPNAIRRALNRAISGFAWCFREVGSVLLPGFFYDRAADESGDFYDWGSLLFDGAFTGDFLFQEPCEYRRGADVLARGVWGSYLTSTVVANPPGTYPPTSLAPTANAAPGANFTLVLTRDKMRPQLPDITPQVGDAIVGLESGVTFEPSVAVADEHGSTERWRCWLDYDEMRGFFVVELPALDDGDFGFAWDVGAHDAFDIALDVFYDGFPTTAAARYSRVWSGVEQVRAGGVEWELLLGDGTCG